MPTLNLFDQDLFILDQGSGPTLVLFADAPHGVRAYHKEADWLAQWYRVIAIDLPGYGGSTRDVLYLDEREYDLMGFAADLACHVLLEMDIAECSAVGIGTGALAALHLAGHQAGLHDMTVHGLVCDSFLANMSPRDIHRAVDRREHYYVRHANELAKEHGEDWRAVCDADSAYWRRLADRGGYAVPDGTLNRIASRTLLTGNMRDVVTPNIAQEHARLSGIIPDCSITLASESGHRYDEQHPLAWSAPERWRGIISSFLARTRP